jgi:hypothetical protein
VRTSLIRSFRTSSSQTAAAKNSYRDWSPQFVWHVSCVLLQFNMQAVFPVALVVVVVPPEEGGLGKTQPV